LSGVGGVKYAVEHGPSNGNHVHREASR
jgi:hypothetical protein